MSEFPKALNTKKAQRWLDENAPKASDLYVASFWLDQSSKHLNRAQKFLKFGVGAMAVGVAAQIVLFIWRASL